MAETVAMGPIVPPPAFPERYEMLAELGRGGMGIVYQVRDRETGEVIALKVLKSEIASDAQILERFKNELRLAHKITHRNVARLYEFHRFVLRSRDQPRCRQNHEYASWEHVGTSLLVTILFLSVTNAMVRWLDRQSLPRRIAAIFPERSHHLPLTTHH